MSTTTSAQQLLRNTDVNAQGGSRDSLWELLERYRGKLVNHAFSILGDHAEAEDVVQETFCDALRDAANMYRVRSIGAWLRSINRDNALDRRRSRKREAGKAQRKQRELPERPFTTGGFTFMELRDQVCRALDRLPPELREVVVLRYWKFLSYEEIARRLNVAPVTVRRHLYAALVHLYKFGHLIGHGKELRSSSSDNVLEGHDPDAREGALPSDPEESA